ncbi:helix-turn-helix transcriptional regulator [Methylobacterium sp. CM6247]
MRVGLPFLEALDRVGCGGIVLTTDGQIATINANARKILQRELVLDDTQIANLPREGRAVLKLLLTRANGRFRLDSEDWIVIERSSIRPLVLQAMRIPEAGITGAHTALIMLDLAEAPQPNLEKLQSIFSLTPAEARLAVLITGGATPTEAGKFQGISVATVRTQLSAIYTKTHTHRQAELVTLVSRLSVLP